jgi:hypothetical protein
VDVDRVVRTGSRARGRAPVHLSRLLLGMEATTTKSTFTSRRMPSPIASNATSELASDRMISKNQSQNRSRKPISDFQVQSNNWLNSVMYMKILQIQFVIIVNLMGMQLMRVIQHSLE